MPTQEELLQQAFGKPNTQDNTQNNTGPYIYDADTIYQDGQGYRIAGIDAPEMSKAALKAERLNKARESKLGQYVSKATAGEAAKLEAEFSTLDFNGIDSGFQETSFNDTQTAPTYQETPASDNTGYYGRPIVENTAYQNKMVADGYAIPAFDNQTPEAQEIMLQAKEQGKGLWADPAYRAEMEVVASKRGTDTVRPIEDYNVLRGVGSASLNVGAKAGSLVGEGIESFGELIGVDAIEKSGTAVQQAATEFMQSGFADKMTGYNSVNVQELSKEIEDTIEKDGYLAAIGNALTDVRSLEVLASSVPEMIALAASVGTMAVANVNNNINIAEAKLKRKLTTNEKVLSAGSSIVGTYLDRFGDKLALSGMNPVKQALKTVVNGMSREGKRSLAKQYGRSILQIGSAPLRLAGAGLVEGATEGAQTLLETAAQTPRVFEKGFEDDEIGEAKVASVLGAVMGTQMATPKVAYDTLHKNEAFQNLSQKGQEILKKRAEAKVTDTEETAVPTEHSVENSKAMMGDILKSYTEAIKTTRGVDDEGNSIEVKTPISTRIEVFSSMAKETNNIVKNSKSKKDKSEYEGKYNTAVTALARILADNRDSEDLILGSIAGLGVNEEVVQDVYNSSLGVNKQYGSGEGTIEDGPSVEELLSIAELEALDALMVGGIDTSTPPTNTGTINVKEQVTKNAEQINTPTEPEFERETSEDAEYTYGISAASIKKQAQKFGLSNEAVAKSLDTAIGVAKIKKMANVGKKANSVQRDIYYGEKGIIPTYIKYRTALQDSDVGSAVEAAEQLQKFGLNQERKADRYNKAYNRVRTMLQDELDTVKDKSVEEQASALQAEMKRIEKMDGPEGPRVKGTSKTDGFTVNVPSVLAEMLVNQELKTALGLDNQISKESELVQSMNESVQVIDTVLSSIGIGRDRHRTVIEYNTDIEADAEAKVAELTKELDAVKSEITGTRARAKGYANGSTEQKEVAKVLKKLNSAKTSLEARLANQTERLARVQAEMDRGVFEFERELTTEEIKDEDTRKQAESESGLKADETKGGTDDRYANPELAKETVNEDFSPTTDIEKIPETLKEIEKKTEELAQVDVTVDKETSDKKRKIFKGNMAVVRGLKDEYKADYREILDSIKKAQEDVEKHKNHVANNKAAVKRAEGLKNKLEQSGQEVNEAYQAVADATKDSDEKLADEFSDTPIKTSGALEDAQKNNQSVKQREGNKDKISALAKAVKLIVKAANTVKLTISQVKTILTTKKYEATIRYLNKSQQKLDNAKKELAELYRKLKEDQSTSKKVGTESVRTLKRVQRLEQEVTKNAVRAEKSTRRQKLLAEIENLRKGVLNGGLLRRQLGKSIKPDKDEQLKVGKLSNYIEQYNTLFNSVPMEHLAVLLDENEAKYYKEVLARADGLDKILTAKPNKDSKGEITGVSKYTFQSSYAAELILEPAGKGVKLNKQFKQIMALVATDWVNNNALGLEFNTDEDIARMRDYVSEFQVTPEDRQLLQKSGSFKKIVTGTLGGQVAKMMGVKAGENMSIEHFDKVKQDLGQMALLAAQSTGDIKELKTSTLSMADWQIKIENGGKELTDAEIAAIKTEYKDITIPMVQVNLTRGDKAAKEAKKKEYTAGRELMKNIQEKFDIDSVKNNYSTKNPNAVKSKKGYEVRDSEFDAPEEMQATVRVLEDQEHKMLDKPVELLMSWLADDAKLEAIKKNMGYQSLESVEADSFDVQDKQEAKNRDIEKAIEELQFMYNDKKNGKIGDAVFFKWFISKNGRYMLDSVGINPQTEKNLHRWLVLPKENVDVEWDLSNEMDELYFLSGLTQAFGIDIDKESTNTIKKVGRALLKADINKLEMAALGMETVKVAGYEMKAPHIGHTIQAIEALKVAQNANGKPFNATMVAEYDAVTSGFILKLLQTPILYNEQGQLDDKKVQEWIAKGGVFLQDKAKKLGVIGKDGKVVKGMNDVLSDPNFLDSYQTLAEAADKKAKALNTVKEETDELGIWPSLRAEGFIQSMVVDGKVTKWARDLFKPPFMTFNYAASINSIKRFLAAKLTEDMVNKLVSTKTEYKDVTGTLKALGINNETEFKAFQTELRTKPLDQIMVKEKRLDRTMEKMFKETYGKIVEDVMVDEFQGLIEVNSAMVNATKMMFRSYNIAFKQKLAEAEASGQYPNGITEKGLSEIIRSLSKRFPIIKAPQSKRREEGVAIISHKKLDRKSEKLDATTTTIVDENAKDGYAVLQVQAMLRELDEAQAAGAVLPIHWIDGTAIGRTLAKGGVLGIHDAIVLGLGGKLTSQRIQEMNADIHDISANYNMLEATLEALVESIENAPQEERAQIEGISEEIGLNEVIGKLVEMVELNRKARAGMYGGDMLVANMAGSSDTVYDARDAKYKTTEVGELVNRAKQLTAEQKQQDGTIHKNKAVDLTSQAIEMSKECM